MAGGIAGNLIGGRGNRLAGTLIGGGLGAAAGYAIDRAEDSGRETYRGRDYDRNFDRPVVRQRPIVRRGQPIALPKTIPAMAHPPLMAGRGLRPAPYGQTGYYYAQPAGLWQRHDHGGGGARPDHFATTTTVTEDYVDVPGPRHYRDKRMLRKGRRH